MLLGVVGRARLHGNVCSLHDYSFDAAEAVAISARRMAAQLFDNVTETKELPTAQAAATNGFVGATVVKLDEFSPRFTCSTGMTEPSCSASADISLTITLLQYQPSATRRSFSVNSQRSSDGPGGKLCSTALTVLSQATSRAPKDVFERAGRCGSRPRAHTHSTTKRKVQVLSLTVL